MKKLCISVGILAVGLLYAQKVSWQKNIASNTQDFLSGLAVTVDGQYLVSGSSIQKNQNPAGNNQNKGYDYHILKLDQQGQKVWEKYFSGNQHDYLSSTVSIREGGFLLAGTSYSSLALDKKDKSNGSSDIWLIKIDENGEEQWQKSIGTRYSEEARSVTQTTDEGYVVAGSTNHSKLGYGSKDVLVVKLDKSGKIISQLILGGNGLDEVEKVIPTKDGGALLGIYSRSGIYEGQSKSKINSKDLNISMTQNSNSESSSNNPSNTAESNSNKQNSESYDITFYGKTFGNFGEGDYWIIKLDKNGAVQWEKNFGGSEDDHIRTMALTGNNGLPIVSSNNNDLKISLDNVPLQHGEGCVPFDSEILITDGNGTKYYFGGGIDNLELNYDRGNPGNMAQLTLGGSKNYISSWYLRQIQYINGDKYIITNKKVDTAFLTFCNSINNLPSENSLVGNVKYFLDAHISPSYVHSVKTFDVSNPLYHSGGTIGNTTPYSSLSLTKKVFPDNIILTNASGEEKFSINFSYLTRDNVVNWNYDSYILDQIIITNRNKAIKTYNFRCDYIKDYSFLKSINSSYRETYSLDYYTGNLPDPNTRQIDYWGFWNGYSNTNLIPEYKLDRNTGELTIITPPSGIRENYIYDTANRLKEIKDINGNILKENKYNYKQ